MAMQYQVTYLFWLLASSRTLNILRVLLNRLRADAVDDCEFLLLLSQGLLSLFTLAFGLEESFFDSLVLLLLTRRLIRSDGIGFELLSNRLGYDWRRT